MSLLKPVAKCHPLERAEPLVAIASEHADAVDRENRFPSEAVDGLREAGLLAAAVPAELGGGGANLSDLCTITRALGTACSSTAMIFAMHQICALNLVDCAMDSPWHRDFLAQSAVKPMLFASATSEAGVGGDLRQSICAVETNGERLTLVKECPVISYGEYADAIFATARRDSHASLSDQVLAVILRAQSDLERTSLWDSLGMRGTSSNGYRLKAEFPPEQVVPRAFADIAADSMVAASHILWSSVWCGIAEAAFSRAQNFVSAGARTNAGPQPSGTRLATAFARLRSVQATIDAVLTEWELARGRPTLNTALSINALKLVISTEALAVVEEALMICGILGYSNNGPYSIARQLRDLHSARLMIGNDRIAVSTGQMLLMQRRPKARPV